MEKIPMRFNLFHANVDDILATNEFSSADFESATAQEKESMVEKHKSVSYWKDAVRRFKNNTVSMVALAVVLLLTIFAFAGPYMIPYSEGMVNGYDNKPISPEMVSFCLFDILEEGLSEHYTIKVFISHDLKIRISKIRYSRVTWGDVMEFDEGIDFLIKNYYYIDSDE